MKKILVALLAIAMLFSFASCDNSGNEPAPTELETSLDAFKNDFFAIVNTITPAGNTAKKMTAKELNTASSKSIEYFYELDGTFEDTAKVEVLGQTFASDATFDVSIGTNNFFSDNVYKIADGKLSVNKAVVLMSLMFDKPLKVNDQVIAEDLGSSSVSALSVTNMTIKGTGNTIKATAEAEGNEYDVYIADSKGLISFEYGGMDKGENGEGGDTILILNEDGTGKVLSTGIDTASANDFGYYLTAYGQPTAGKTATTYIRDNIVISDDGAVKGTYTITFNATFPAAQ